LRVGSSSLAALKPNPLGEIHESLQGVWVALGKKERAISVTALVHESVKQRISGCDYSPSNLPKPPNYIPG